jgi:hypothetical protein
MVYGLAEAPQIFQAGWSDCIYMFLFLCLFPLLIWDFRVCYCTYEGTVPYRSCNVGRILASFFVVLGILEPQTARH